MHSMFSYRTWTWIYWDWTSTTLVIETEGKQEPGSTELDALGPTQSVFWKRSKRESWVRVKAWAKDREQQNLLHWSKCNGGNVLWPNIGSSYVRSCNNWSKKVKRRIMKAYFVWSKYCCICMYARLTCNAYK